jgi:2-polyprenyl-6-methoxyphenol hydroxylase-like FAD-dependent oxidoreductase
MEVAEAKYVVGTDGGRSRVRKELGLAFDGETLAGAMIIGDIRMDGLDPLVSNLCDSSLQILWAHHYFSLDICGRDRAMDGMTVLSHQARLLTSYACRAMFFPASRRPNHPFAMRLMLPPGNTMDLDALVKDPEATRQVIRGIMDRQDIELGDFTYLAVYRFVQSSST